MWTEPSFDPETNLAYFGTGNPVHMFDPQGRPGDNLYTNSIIALDVDTGKLKWYFQTIPNEGWDYDAVAITQLYDVTVGGEMRKVISQTNRNGFHYTLDRTNGQFLRGKPFTTVNWTAGLDPKTGKPARLRCGQDRAGLCRPGGAIRQEGGRRAPRPLRHADPHAEHVRCRRAGSLIFNAMIGEANYFNSRPADPARGSSPAPASAKSSAAAIRRKTPSSRGAQRPQPQLQSQPRPARRHRRPHRRNW